MIRRIREILVERTAIPEPLGAGSLWDYASTTTAALPPEMPVELEPHFSTDDWPELGEHLGWTGPLRVLCLQWSGAQVLIRLIQLETSS